MKLTDKQLDLVLAKLTEAERNAKDNANRWHTVYTAVQKHKFYAHLAYNRMYQWYTIRRACAAKIKQVLA